MTFERYTGQEPDEKREEIPSSIDLMAGDLTVTGFLVDMNRVFEDWLTATLTVAISDRGGLVRPQLRTWLDEAQQVPVRPDLTWWHRGRCIAVIDAKYKALQPADLPNADLYQMLPTARSWTCPAATSSTPAGNRRRPT